MTDDHHTKKNRQSIIGRMKTIPDIDEHQEMNGQLFTRLDHLIATFRKATGEKFTGFIKVNFTQGSIGRVEKFEEILKK